MFDFEKSFTDYVKSQMISKKMDMQMIENEITSMHEEWMNTKVDALGGQSPLEHIKSCDDGELLCKYIKAQAKLGVLVEIYDKALSLPNALIPLLDLLEGNDSEAGKVALSILMQREDKVSAKILIDYIIRQEDLYDITDIADKVSKSAELANDLIDESENYNESTKLLIADIVTYCTGNNKVFDYLVHLLFECDNTQFIAGLFARFGDERAIKAMTVHAQDCNFADYRELKNAIEMLGGSLVDDRDFSDDETYNIIKDSDSEKEE